MDLERRLRELATMNAIGEILNEEADFIGALRLALERLVPLVGLSAGWVFLTRTLQGDAHEGSFRLAASCGLPAALARDDAAALREESCECLGLLQKGKLDKGVNIVTCSRLYAARGDKGGLKIHASVPLLGRSGVVGVMNLAAPGGTRLSAETLAFLTAIGRQLGTAFDRARLLEERTREARLLAVLEERQRLAREMHDSVSQLLFAADLAVRAAKESPDGQREGLLDRSAELVEAALAELRALVEVLRPADLSAGLPAALTRLAARTAAAVGVHLEADPVDLDEAQAEGLYRIAQEALHNALRHAEAKNVWLKLQRRERGVALTIEDDGRGLEPGYREGLGLSSMKARAKALGGTLALQRRGKGGTTVKVLLP